MNFPWAICLAREDAGSLAALRLVGGIEVGDAGAAIWLRGQRGDERLAARLAGLPARERYQWLAPNQLRRIDQRIAATRLPDLRWQPLNEWLQVEMPAAAIPGAQPAPIPLRLVPSACEQEPELLLTSIGELSEFTVTAAQVRLACLTFAANAEGMVLVRGRPLPPLPGRRYALHGNLAVPAGFSWEPAVGADVLMRRVGVSGDTLVVWNEDGTLTRLHGEQFVPVSRSAIRETEKAIARPT